MKTEDKKKKEGTKKKKRKDSRIMNHPILHSIAFPLTPYIALSLHLHLHFTLHYMTLYDTLHYIKRIATVGFGVWPCGAVCVSCPLVIFSQLVHPRISNIPINIQSYLIISHIARDCLIVSCHRCWCWVGALLPWVCGVWLWPALCVPVLG
jgi:hypothetical protein